MYKVCRLNITVHLHALITYDTRSSWSKVCENGDMEKPSAGWLETSA